MTKHKTIDSKTIDRRDFLNGAAVTLAASAALPLSSAQAFLGSGAAAQEANVYPPSLTGLRGNHPGSFDVAHSLAWNGDAPIDFEDTGEEYDLVVVGGGISGLAAAHFYQREKGPDQRILILENHDDFGGHAKRNEFTSGGHMLLGIGGAVNLEEPFKYNRVVKKLLKEIGIDLKALEQSNDPEYPMASMAGDYGVFVKTGKDDDQAVIGRWTSAYRGIGDYKSLVEQLPYPDVEKEKIQKFVGGDWDFLVGLSVGERMDYLSSTSYHQFLRDKVGLAEETLSLFDTQLRLLAGVAGDAVSVSEAINGGAPGLGSVGWPWALAEDLFFDEDKPYTALFFPDGNSSVARLMVRHLIPDVGAGNTMSDIVTSRFDYGKLDEEGASVRLRLNSTVVKAREEGGQVTVSYVQNGKPSQVKAKHCILASYNAIIPYLCPELPEEQKEGLKYGSKAPFVWANVVLREGTPFYASGAEAFECPNSYFGVVTKSPPMKTTDYQTPTDPSDPLVIFMMRAPAQKKDEGKTVRDLFRATRYELLETPFSTFEEEVRGQLTDMFGAHGFDADRDIEALTINRWSHGYAYSYMELDDLKFEKGSYPHEVGRKQFGRISIANSDSEAKAYLNAAIDAAWRAVREQLSL